ncbi:MAG TPA: phage portal protein [Patescibacteria group bacterium]|jgi:hypothetical protein|nr:phage portal protein [Patescibacteria group bacterium]
MNLAEKLLWTPLANKVASRVQAPIITGIKEEVAKSAANGELRKDTLQGYPYATATGKPMGAQRYQFDYNHQGTQMRRKPNSNISFQILREFSTSYEVARACINARKRQITSLEWEIVPMDDMSSENTMAQNTKKYSSDITLVSQFFNELGGPGVRFRSLLDMIVEDLLVLDAVALLRKQTVGGDLMYLSPLDAATIKLVVDEFGNTPEPPNPAYKQVIRGAVTAEMTTDELIYDMMNPRSSTPYGLAPLESLIIVISSALRGNLFNLNYLTDGNVPEGLMSMPADWSMTQIKEYQEVWDAYIAGDARAGSRLRFTPGGPGVGYTPTKKRDEMAFGEFQQWLMLCTCAMFDVQPQEIGFTLHHSTKANASEQGNIQTRRGILPTTNVIREIFRDIIHKDLGMPHLDYAFRGMEDRDMLMEAEARQVDIFTGFKTIDEARSDEGLDPLGINEPFVVGNPSFLKSAMVSEKEMAENPTGEPTTPAGSTANDDGTADAPDSGSANSQDPAQQSDSTDSSQKATAIDLMNELRKFQMLTIKRLKDGKSPRMFKSDLIEPSVLNDLNSQVLKAKDISEVREIISEYKKEIDLDKQVAMLELKETLAKIAGQSDEDLALKQAITGALNVT